MMGPEWFIIVWLSCPAIIKDVAPLLMFVSSLGRASHTRR